jgi:hypothetical protein
VTKLVILALAGGAESHERNELAQRETWAARLPQGVEVFWIHCVEDLAASEIKVSERLINVAIAERYENLLAKTVEALGIVLAEFNPDYVLRTNTSSYLDARALLEQIDAFQAEPVYGGYVGNFNIQLSKRLTPSKDLKFASGAGIWLSSNFAHEVSQIDVRRFEHLVDDVAIGAYFHERNVSLTPVARVNVTDFEPTSYGAHTRVKHWSDDEVTFQRMYELDAIYMSADVWQLEKNLLAFDRAEIRRLRRNFQNRLDHYALKSLRIVKSRSLRSKQFANALFST